MPNDKGARSGTEIGLFSVSWCQPLGDYLLTPVYSVYFTLGSETDDFLTTLEIETPSKVPCTIYPLSHCFTLIEEFILLMDLI